MKFLEWLGLEHPSPERFPSMLSACYWNGGIAVTAQVRIVNDTGALLVTRERWYIGTILSITFQYELEADETKSLESMTVFCKVARHEQDGMRVQFVFVSSRQRKAIVRFFARVPCRETGLPAMSEATAADTERELKDVIVLMAKTIGTAGERDGQYAREVTELTERLRSIVTLNDLATIRRSIIESASALTDCVQRITSESQTSLHRLSAEIEEYRTRLEKSERLSTLDPLTGLANRRRLEELLDRKMSTGDRFSLILIDLDGFKAVNDRFGHLAGDDLLKQFAGELRGEFQMADLVARWGGDEFVVIIACSQKEATARLLHLRRKVLGDYKVSNGSQIITIPLGASTGVVEWDGKESARDLLSRADDCMYNGKQSAAMRAG